MSFCRSGVALLGTTVFMHGGTSGSKYYNDLFAFDLTTQEWRLITPCGDIPSERCGHALVADIGQGLHTRDSSGRAAPLGSSTRAMSSDALVVSRPKCPWYLYSVGGSKDSEGYHKVYRLTVPLKLQLQASFPSMLLGHQQDEVVVDPVGSELEGGAAASPTAEKQQYPEDVDMYMEVIQLLMDKLLQLENRLAVIQHIEMDSVLAPILHSLIVSYDTKKDAETQLLSNRSSVGALTNNSNRKASQTSIYDGTPNSPSLKAAALLGAVSDPRRIKSTGETTGRNNNQSATFMQKRVHSVINLFRMRRSSSSRSCVDVVAPHKSTVDVRQVVAPNKNTVSYKKPAEADVSAGTDQSSRLEPPDEEGEYLEDSSPPSTISDDSSYLLDDNMSG
eukprot:GHVS01048132.1.p1 GENE.GHVS01048132.1~~GHVS01048132.1.p1  ORF type:complete len:391 (+),score=72.26 GHVS01048132.1:45-1217(+)